MHDEASESFYILELILNGRKLSKVYSLQSPPFNLQKIKHSIFCYSYHALWFFLDELKIENNKKNEK